MGIYPTVLTTALVVSELTVTCEVEMARFAVGDIQGCFLTLLSLLEEIKFSPDSDTLWLTGDIVNRGPRSRETLQWVYEHRSIVRMVLGNHDLHLIARSLDVRRGKSRDTLDSILSHPMADAWLDWLRQQPLLRTIDDQYLLVHAGLMPKWSEEEALKIAAQVSDELKNGDTRGLIRDFFSGRTVGAATPAIATSLQAFTLLRALDRQGNMVLSFNQTVADLPKGMLPWYAYPEQPMRRHVLFGHWAAHGYGRHGSASCLDSGCVWGRKLTALNLDTGIATQVPYAD